MIPSGTVCVCVSPAARKGKWRSIAGRRFDGPRYRDRVTVEASAFFTHERLLLTFKEWPGEFFFAEHFRPVHNILTSMIWLCSFRCFGAWWHRLSDIHMIEAIAR